jgi:hypothetical protein
VRTRIEYCKLRLHESRIREIQKAHPNKAFHGSPPHSFIFGLRSLWRTSVNADVLPLNTMRTPLPSFVVESSYAIFIHWCAITVSVFLGFNFGRFLPREELFVIPLILVGAFVAGWITRRKLGRSQTLLAAIGATANMSIVPVGFLMEFLNTPNTQRTHPAVMLIAIVPVLVSILGSLSSAFFERRFHNNMYCK